MPRSDLIKHWRSRAEAMRAVAEPMRDAEARATALLIAEDFDRLAQQAEERSWVPGHILECPAASEAAPDTLETSIVGEYRRHLADHVPEMSGTPSIAGEHGSDWDADL